MDSLWKGFERRPGDPVLFAKLRDALERESDYDGLRRLYHRRAEAVSGEEALYLYLTIAEVWAARQGDAQGCADAYEQALALSASLSEREASQLRDALSELFTSRQDWRSLRELTAAEAARQPEGPARSTRLIDLGDLQRDKLQDVAGAAISYRQAAEQDSSGPGLERLRELLDHHPDSDVVFDQLREHLEENVEEGGRLDHLLALLQHRLDRTREETPERANTLVAMGDLLSRHGDDIDAALSYYTAADQNGARTNAVVDGLLMLASKDGFHVGVLYMLRMLLPREGDWERMVEFGRREAELTAEPNGRAQIYFQIGTVLLEEINDLDEAAVALSHAYEFNPGLRVEIVEQAATALANEPNHRAMVRLLARLYRDGNDYDALLALLETEEAIAESETARAQLLVDMAEICAEHIGRQDKAIEYYEAAADLAADDAGRLIRGLRVLYDQGYYIERVERTLRQLARATGQFDELVSLLVVQLESAATPLDAASLHYELATVLEHELEEFEDAMQHYQRAFRLDSSHPEYIEGGRNLYRRMGNVEMVARLYDVQLKVVSSPEQAATLLLEKARVLADELGDPARALEALGRASALAPENQPVQNALVEVASGTDGLAALEDLEKAYLLADRPAEAAAIYLLISDNLRAGVERDPDDPEAESLLSLANTFDLRAYRLDPTTNAQVRAAQRLEKGLVAEGRFEELVELLERRARESAPDERQGYLTALAQVAGKHLGDVQVAVTAWRSVLEVDIEREDAFEELVALLREASDYEQLAEVLRLVLRAAPWADPNMATDRHVELLSLLADVEGRMGHQEAVDETWRKVIDLRPNHEQAVGHYRALSASGDAEDAAELFRILELGVVELLAPNDRAARRLKMASLAESQLGDPLLAIDQYQAILDLLDVDRETVAEARRELERLLRERGDFDALAELLEAEIAARQTTDERRIERLHDLVTLHEEERGDIESTKDALLRLADLLPDDPSPRLRLADAFHHQNAHYEEANVLRQLIELGESGGWTVIPTDGGRMLRLPDLELRLGMLEVRTGDLDDARARLHRLLESESHRNEALRELQQLLLRLGDHAGLTDLLRHQVENARDTSDKVHYLSRMAMLAEQELGDSRRAIGTWLEVLELRPNDVDALSALEALYEQLERWYDVVETCETRLKVTTDRLGRARLYRKIARIQRQHGDLDDARDVLTELLTEAPDDLLARQELYEIYRALEDWASLAEVIEDLLRYETDPGRRHDLLRELAGIATEKLERPDVAVEALERVMTEFPGDVASAEQLLALHESRGHWPKAADVVARRIEIATDDADKIAMLWHLAMLHKDRLRDVEQAAVTLRRLLEVHDNHHDALATLDNLYSELGNYEELAWVKGRLLELANDVPRKVVLLQALAEIAEDALEDAGKAFTQFSRLHELEPSATDYLDELYRLAAEHPELWPALLEVLRADMARAPSVDEKLEVQLRIAQLVETHLGQPLTAFDTYAEIFTSRPRTGHVLEQLERLADAHPTLWGRVVGFHGRLAGPSAEPEQAVAALFRMAEIQANHLGQPEAAFETLRQALALDVLTAQTQGRLRELADRANLWEEFARVGQERWQRLAERSDQVRLLIDTADVFADKLGDTERALEHYVLAFQIDPDNKTIEERLTSFAERTGAWDLLVKLYALVGVERERAGDAAGQLRFIVAEAQSWERAGQLDEAFEAVERAFWLAPANIDVRSELERIGSAAGRLLDVAGAYRTQADSARREDSVMFLIAAARLLLGPLKQRDEAAESLRRVLQLDPDASEARTLLENLYREDDDVESLVALHAQRAERTTQRHDRFAAYLQVAELILQTDDPERAVEYYRRALRLEPHNIEVLEDLARLYEKLGQPDRRARCLEQIAEVAETEDGELLVDTIQTLAGLYAEHGRTPKAIDAHKRLTQLRPTRQDFRQQAVDILLADNRIDELLVFYDELVTKLDVVAAALDSDALTEADELRLRDITGALPRSSSIRSQQRELLRAAVALAEKQRGGKRRAVELLSQMVDRDPADADALEHLASLHGELGQWQQQLEALEKRVVSATGHARALVLRQLAEVYEEKAADPDKAAQRLVDLLADNPDDRTVHADLGRLYARIGRHQEAVASLVVAASPEGDALPDDLRSEILTTMAGLWERELRDPDQAARCLEEAVDADPNNALARKLLRAHLERLGRHGRQIELLEMDVATEPEPGPRAQLLWELGVLLRDHTDRLDDALTALDRASTEDPTFLGAQRDLADLAFVAQRWDIARDAYLSLLEGGVFTRVAMESEPLAPERLRDNESTDDPAFVLYTARLGQVLEALGQMEDAARRYHQALRVRSMNLVSLYRLGRHLLAQGDDDTALRYLNKLLTLHGSELDAADRADVNAMLATIAHREKQLDRTLRHARAALDDGPHAAAARLGYEVCVANERHSDAAFFLEALVEAADNDRERVAMLGELGSLYLEKLERATDAHSALSRALDLAPDDLDIAERLLELHLSRSAWQEAKAVIARLIEADEHAVADDPLLGSDDGFNNRRAVHLGARADIARALGNTDDALADYAEALELSPDDAGLVRRMCLALAQANRMVEAYEQCDEFVAQFGSEAVATAIYDGLASDLLHELKRPELARDVLLRLTSRVPGHVPAWQELVELYVGDALDDPHAALQCLRTIVRIDGISEDRLRRMLALYSDLGLDGEALQLLRLLDFCRCATPEEQRSLRDRSDGLADLAAGQLAGTIRDTWVLPNRASGPLARLWAFVATRAFAAIVQPLAQCQVGPDDLISSKRNLNVANIFREARAVVGLDDCELYLNRSGMEGVAIVASRPAAVVIGEDVFRGLFNKEQRFVLGRALARCHPAFLVASTREDDEVAALLTALVERTGRPAPDFEVVEEASVATWHQRLDETLDEEAEAELEELVAACEEGLVSAAQWRAAVATASVRMGVLLGGDPLVALKRLIREQKNLRAPSMRSCDDLAAAMEGSDDVRDVVLFVLSDDYLRARRALQGEELGPPPPPLTVSDSDLPGSAKRGAAPELDDADAVLPVLNPGLEVDEDEDEPTPNVRSDDGEGELVEAADIVDAIDSRPVQAVMRSGSESLDGELVEAGDIVDSMDSSPATPALIDDAEPPLASTMAARKRVSPDDIVSALTSSPGIVGASDKAGSESGDEDDGDLIGEDDIVENTDSGMYATTNDARDAELVDASDIVESYDSGSFPSVMELDDAELVDVDDIVESYDSGYYAIPPAPPSNPSVETVSESGRPSVAPPPPPVAPPSSEEDSG